MFGFFFAYLAFSLAFITIAAPIMIGYKLNAAISRWILDRYLDSLDTRIEYNTDVAADILFNRKPRKPFDSIFDN